MIYQWNSLEMGKVYVGRLGSDPLEESDLEDEFEDFGQIKESSRVI